MALRVNARKKVWTMYKWLIAVDSSCDLPEAEYVIAVAISSRLSSSWASAMTAREIFLEQNPDRRVLVIDSRSTGPAPSLISLRARAN